MGRSTGIGGVVSAGWLVRWVDRGEKEQSPAFFTAMVAALAAVVVSDCPGFSFRQRGSRGLKGELGGGLSYLVRAAVGEPSVLCTWHAWFRCQLPPIKAPGSYGSLRILPRNPAICKLHHTSSCQI